MNEWAKSIRIIGESKTHVRYVKRTEPGKAKKVLKSRFYRRYHGIVGNLSEPHLGGHFNIAHIDRGALKFMQNKLGCQSLIDIGCGPGDNVRAARKMGYQAMGIDGDKELIENGWSSIDDLTIHDYTMGTFNTEKQFDVAWCVEFLEHVEEKYQKNYMNTFQKCKYVVCTAAEPGEPGWHHVNCQSKD